MPGSSSPSTPTATTTPARSPTSCACSSPAAAGSRSGRAGCAAARRPAPAARGPSASRVASDARSPQRRHARRPRRDDVVLGRRSRGRANRARRRRCSAGYGVLLGVRRARPGLRLLDRRGADLVPARATPASTALSLGDVSDFARSMPLIRRRTQRGPGRRCAPTRRRGRAGRAGCVDQEAAAGSSFGADVELERLAERRPLLRLDRRRAGAASRATDPRGRRRHRHGVAGAPRAPARRPDHRPGAGPPSCTTSSSRARSGDPRDPDAASHVDRPAARPTWRRRSTRSSTSTSSSTSSTTPASCATARDLLVPGGTLAVFVPALPRLYGEPRLQVRAPPPLRARTTLRGVGRPAAGFELVDLRYLDVLGVAPYFAMYRLLDVKSLGSVSSRRLRPGHRARSAERSSGSCPIRRSARTCSPSLGSARCTRPGRW